MVARALWDKAGCAGATSAPARATVKSIGRSADPLNAGTVSGALRGKAGCATAPAEATVESSGKPAKVPEPVKVAPGAAGCGAAAGGDGPVLGTVSSTTEEAAGPAESDGTKPS